MNILSITAGAAEMYCGSCLRDNALAAALVARGHQVTLQPIYTPTVTDEPNMSAGRRVFYGGISVYLEQHFSIFRHTPWLLDRLWDAPGVIKRFAARAIDVDPRLLGALTVSTLKGEGGYQRKEVGKLLEWLTGEPRPDVVNLPNSMLIALAAPIRRALDRPVVVTLQGDDLFLDGLTEPYRTEALDLIRQQVAEVDLFVSVSEYYTDYMAKYLEIPPSRIRTVPLGVNLKDLVPRPVARDFSPATADQRPFTIGYFARIAPEKGLHNLVDAYRILRQERGLPPARLRVAGWMASAQRPYLAELERKLAGWNLGGEFEYLGAVDRSTKVRFLHDLDLLSVPTDYHEPKGLFVLEAMACGVPVVQPTHGAFPTMIQRTGGGLLSASQRPNDVADAIAALWRDPARAARLGRQGAEGVRAHYTIDRMTDRMLDVYRESWTAVLEASQLTKSYPSPAGDLTVLAGVSLTLAPGEAAAITGPSGSGKSTLLYVLGALEPPTSGTMRLDGQNPYELGPQALAGFRNKQVGFVFQDHCLLPQCSVLENVLVPTLVGERDHTAADRARALLDEVGLGERLHHRPAALSGGEKQRAAIARALIRQPRLVLCDEPTGNLDADTAARVADVLLDLHQRQKTMLIVVTHSETLASRFRRRWRIDRGRLT